MRLVFWNCNMALHRKMAALQALSPDIAVISECADPETLVQRGLDPFAAGSVLWMGRNRQKGLGVFAFTGAQLTQHEPFWPTLRYILPLHVAAPVPFGLIAVWAQNASGGVTRKHQQGPLRRALTKYRGLLTAGPAIVGGDWNSNVIWDRPGWRINHIKKVRLLEELGLVSVYHALRGEAQGEEREPTHYWRDRREDGPTYHIDHVFLPRDWLPLVRDFQVGGFADWVGNGLSDHVPLILDLDLPRP
ncbi:MAG: hypothetical protein AAGE18_16440 [Pseudomonadota bacterium]